jgi:hypothetical protein
MTGDRGSSRGDSQRITGEELASRAAVAALTGPDLVPGQWVYRRNARDGGARADG